MGVAQFEFSGGTSAALLITLQNGIADANVLMITNGQEYMEELDKLLNSLKMGKFTSITKPNTNTNTTPSNINKSANTNKNADGMEGV
jgi:hypothetical protein